MVWGLAFIIVKPSFEVTTPFRYLLYRFVLAAFFSLPILIYYLRRIQITWKNLAIITALESIGTGLALALVYWGLKYAGAIEANLLTSSLPIFVIAGSILLLRENQEKHELKGMIFAVAGTLILTLIPFILGESNSVLRLSVIGNLLILGHNLANAVYYPLAKKYYRKLPKLLVTSISFYVGILTFFVLSLFEAGSLNELLNFTVNDWQYPSVWAASLYMAVFGSIIGLTAYIKGQDGIEASEAALFGYLQPLIYLPLGVWLLQEKFTVWHLSGLLLITAGVYLAERRSSPAVLKPRRH